MRKKRIFSLLLSVIMVLSVCASPFSSVFAASSSDDPSTVAYTVTGSELTEAINAVLSYNEKEASTCPGLDLLCKNTINGYGEAAQEGALDALNPFDGVELVLSILDLALSDDTEKPDSHEVIMKKLDDISVKIDDYHTQIKTVLERIELKIDTRDFKNAIQYLGSYNSTAITSIKVLDERPYFKDKTKIEDITDENDKKQLTNLYEEIERVTTNNADYIAKFQITCKDIYLNNAFDLALKCFKSSYSDPATVNKYYKEYLTATMKDLILSYYCLVTGWKAQVNRCKMDPYKKSSVETGTSQGRSLAAYLKRAIDRYLKAMQTDCNVMTVKVGSGGEKSFHTFSSGWSVVTKSLEDKQDVEVTLNQDLTATNVCGFAPQAYGDTSNKNGYTREGGLYINSGGKLTLNLNGHQIDGKNRRNMYLFECATDAKLTINGLSSLKEGQVQGLYNASRAISFDVGKELILNNVQMKNFTDCGVYAGCNDGSAVFRKPTFIYNGGSIENAKNSAIRIWVLGKFTISNCEFKNNTAEKGGGIWGAGKSIEVSTISNCKFESNTASKDGGAIYYSGWNDQRLTVENCTFTKNTARLVGGATYLVNNITGCTFTENTAERTHSGAAYGARTVKNCTFTGNKSESYGGGAITVRDDQEDFYVENSTFINNYSKNNGGAIFIPNSASSCTPTLVNCTFKGNRSDNEGGAIFAGTKKELKVKNSTFTENSTKQLGGAIGTRNRCQVFINDSTFTGNKSDWDGGALFLTGLSGTWHQLTDVTIENNYAKHRGGGVYCDHDNRITADVELHHKVVIANNSAGGNWGDDVLLEQCTGSGKSVLKTYASDGSRVGIDTDYNASRDVVWNADDNSLSRFYGTNGRSLYKDGSDLKINETSSRDD